MKNQRQGALWKRYLSVAKDGQEIYVENLSKEGEATLYQKGALKKLSALRSLLPNTSWDVFLVDVIFTPSRIRYAYYMNVETNETKESIYSRYRYDE